MHEYDHSFVVIGYLASESNAKNLTKLPSSAGGRLNKKDGLTRYGNSHVKDKTS